MGRLFSLRPLSRSSSTSRAAVVVKKNFDVRVKIKGQVINADAKTRKDDFPFKLPPERVGQRGVKYHAGRRETIDPHDAATLGIRREPAAPGLHHILTPESTVLRQILLDALAQLPESGCNLVLLGHISGQRHSLEEALYGTEIYKFRKNFETRKVTLHEYRTPTGAFGSGQEGDLFSPLSGVLWFRLWGYERNFGRAYHLYQNSNSRLEEVYAKWSTPSSAGWEPSSNPSQPPVADSEAICPELGAGLRRD
jgi:hypothetical protein